MPDIHRDLELILVYNADSSLPSQILDFAHKIISPQTYQCNLCRVTHNTFGAKQEWKEFIKTIPCQATFLHKDEFISEFPAMASTQFPAVFRKEGNLQISLLIGAAQLNEIHSIEQLKHLLISKLNY